MGNSVRQVERNIAIALAIYCVAICVTFFTMDLNGFMTVASTMSIFLLIIMAAMVATLLLERPMTSLALLLAGILSGPAIAIYFLTGRNICREIAEFGKELDTDFFLWKVRTVQKHRFR